ncbi:MAG: hypothetical protein AB4290_00425 [Spirulina sp.]
MAAEGDMEFSDRNNVQLWTIAAGKFAIVSQALKCNNEPFIGNG